MQRQDKTERKAEIDRLLAELAKSTSPEVRWMNQLFELQYEDVKERLVAATGDDLIVAQGEARFLLRFHKQFAAASALLKR